MDIQHDARYQRVMSIGLKHSSSQVHPAERRQNNFGSPLHTGMYYRTVGPSTASPQKNSPGN